jgi:hypothetical protein
VDPVTGAQTAISQGGLFIDPVDVAIGPPGFVYVLDQTLRGIVRIDLGSGAQQLVSSGGLITAQVYGFGVDPSGDLLVADPGVGVAGSLLAVDHVTGVQRVLSTDQLFTFPADVLAALSSGPGALSPVAEPASTLLVLAGLLSWVALRSRQRTVATQYLAYTPLPLANHDRGNPRLHP